MKESKPTEMSDACGKCLERISGFEGIVMLRDVYGTTDGDSPLYGKPLLFFGERKETNVDFFLKCYPIKTGAADENGVWIQASDAFFFQSLGIEVGSEDWANWINWIVDRVVNSEEPDYC